MSKVAALQVRQNKLGFCKRRKLILKNKDMDLFHSLREQDIDFFNRQITFFTYIKSYWTIKELKKLDAPKIYKD